MSDRDKWSGLGRDETYTGNYETQYFFLNLGIIALRQKTVRDAVKHFDAMVEVKQLVTNRLSKKVIAGSYATREDFVSAVEFAVKQVRATYPDLSSWRYFSSIAKPGKEKAVRSNVNPVLAEALTGWCGICKSEGVGNISELAGMDDRRRSADNFAAQALEKVRDGCFPSDKVALSALRLWGFDKNTNRPNVIPDKDTWVHSDTLGIIKDRTDHTMKMSKASQEHRNFQQLLTLWLRGRLPPCRRRDPLPYTTISVNKGYGAKLHRDRFNEGPSVGIAVGPFTGGGLRYYPNDDKVGDLTLLRKQSSVVLDLKRKPNVFDGNRGHSVEPFKGERFSLIFFSVKGFTRVGAASRRDAKRGGSDWPSSKSLQHLRKWLPSLKAMDKSDAPAVKSKK